MRRRPARRSVLRAERVVFGMDPAARFLPWIAGMMVFIATLAGAAALLVDNAAERWRAGIVGGLTIQLPADARGGVNPEALRRTIEYLNGVPGIAEVRPIGREAVSHLVEPWLGPAAGSPDLPLPALIDVTLHDEPRVDVPALAERLREISPGVTVDDHALWLERLVTWVEWGRLAARAAVGLIIAVGAATVVFLTLARLAIHADAVALLHLMGASDGFVARQFERRAALATFAGGLAGTVAAAALLAGLETAAGTLAAAALPVPRLAPPDWALLAAGAPAAALVAWLTARLTVLIRLRGIA